MAAQLNLKVLFHFEVVGRKSGPELSRYCQPTANTYDAIKTSLSNGGSL